MSENPYSYIDEEADSLQRSKEEIEQKRIANQVLDELALEIYQNTGTDFYEIRKNLEDQYRSIGLVRDDKAVVTNPEWISKPGNFEELLKRKNALDAHNKKETMYDVLRQAEAHRKFREEKERVKSLLENPKAGFIVRNQ